MDIQQARMDFEFESMSRELVEVIETGRQPRSGEEPAHSRPDFLPREEAFKIPDLIRTKINLLPPGIPFVRTLEIVGLDLQADGGTHVHSTAEVWLHSPDGLQKQGQDQQNGCTWNWINRKKPFSFTNGFFQ